MPAVYFTMKGVDFKMAYPWEAYQPEYKTYPPRGISSNGMDIVENPDTSTPSLIGHTIAWCNELESAANEALDRAEKYYNRLVEIGDIVPEKTSEQLTLELLQSLTGTIETLNKKVAKLEKDGVNNGCKCANTSDKQSEQKGSGKNTGKPADTPTGDAGSK